jgi:hypothetical protein
MLELPKADLLATVMLAESILKQLVPEQKVPGKYRGMYSACATGAREAAAQKVKEVEETLADLFSDVE